MARCRRHPMVRTRAGAIRQGWPKAIAHRAGAGELAGVVHRNIQALIEVRRQFERRKSSQERVADGITRFTPTRS